MKFCLVILFVFLSLVSCRTTRLEGDKAQPPGEELVGDVISDGTEEEDLESEFADSEDFEKEMAEESFPSEEGAEDQVAEKPVDSDEDDVVELDEEDEDLLEEEGGPERTEVAEGGQVEEGTAETEEATEDDVVQQEEEDSEAVSTGETVVVNHIRYSAGENKIYIDGTGHLSHQQRENTANNQFIVEIDNAVLSEGLRERPFVMKDFNTDMALIQADQKDSSTVRIVVQMRENASMPSLEVGEGGSLIISPMGGGGPGTLAGPADTTDGDLEEGTGVGGDMAGEVLPAKSLEEFFLKTPRFTGRPISIHFKQVDVRDALYFISEGTGLNMVLDEEVSGNISIKLRNVPWDQALITVMKTKKLGYVREGNVIRIMKLASLRTHQEAMQKMLEKQKVLEDMKVKVIPIEYAKAGDIKKHADLFLSKTEGGAQGRGGQTRGKVVVDTQSNSLIVVDTEKAIKRIEAMVKNLDRSPTQVMIEAKVVEAREDFVRDLGVSWDYEGTDLSMFEGTDLALNVDGGLNIFASDSAGGSTANTSLNLFFAPFGDLDIDLGLSEVEGEARVISAPRVLVLNGETATINQSSESISPKTTTTAQETSTTAERDTADLSFKVTPNITSLGSIFMDIDVTRQFFGARETVTRARPKFTRSAKTKVLVNNGQTVVIGGIYQYDEQKGEEGFPILRHIPILNLLFARFTRDQQKNELLLFLTPRVLEFTAQRATEIN